MITYCFEIPKSYDDEHSLYKVLETIALDENHSIIVLPLSNSPLWNSIQSMCERLDIPCRLVKKMPECEFVFKLNDQKKLECFSNDVLGS